MRSTLGFVLCALLGALGGALFSSRAPTDSASIAAAESNEGDTSQELSDQRRRLNALERRLAEREPANLAQPSIQESEPESDRAEATAPTPIRPSEEERIQAATALFDEHVALPPDPNWSQAQEALVRNHFAQPELAGFVLENLRCGAELCRMNIRSRDAGSQPRDLVRLLAVARLEQGQMFWKETGPEESVVYLSRKGSELPAE